MTRSSCPAPALIEDSSLADWAVIGSGGFGLIYKARHLRWCCDVAVKLLHHDDGTSRSLLREVDLMRRGSSPYVIRVLGVFRGRPPPSPSAQLGLVMEVMERGSLASLQKALCGPPPWPLVFRLAHQVALGLNFLHTLSPALLHLDLKPSNVLLDSDLNAKLTDFGLARIHQTITRSREAGQEGGTISYMPPEAFDLSYCPSRASDIYSLGILLWSIVTGKQPYENAMSCMVRFRIPQGDRPALDGIRTQAAGRAGLSGLMDLMERCWAPRPEQRPSSYVCTTETEDLNKMHRRGVVDAVHRVLKRLDEKEEESLSEQIQRVQVTQTSVMKSRCQRDENVGDVPTGRPPVQEMAAGQRDEASVKGRSQEEGGVTSLPVCHVDLGRPSSVQPIQTSQHAEGHRFAPASKWNDKILQHEPKRFGAGFERQFSSPDPFSCRPPGPEPGPGPGLHIFQSHVTGFQHGNNNVMHIHTEERRRHPTAPSAVSLPPRDQRGGAC